MSINEAIEKQLALLDWHRAIQSSSDSKWVKELKYTGINAAVGRSLEYGNTYFWSNDFCKLLEGQANMLPDDAVINITDFLSEAGFIWFERPIKMPINLEKMAEDIKEWTTKWEDAGKDLQDDVHDVSTRASSLKIALNDYLNIDGSLNLKNIKEAAKLNHIVNVVNKETGENHKIDISKPETLKAVINTLGEEWEPLTRDIDLWKEELLFWQSQIEPRPLRAISWVLTSHGPETIAMFMFWMEDKVLAPIIGIIPVMVIPWPINKNLTGLLEFTNKTPEEKFNNDDPDRQAQAIKYACASILFMNQRVFHHVDERPSRAVRHRITKWRPEPIIKVIQLRRHQQHANTNPDHDPVEHDFQWMVTGHWRNQWYPSTGTHATIWIAPYIKGPEDKPLKEPRGRVYAVVR